MIDPEPSKTSSPLRWSDPFKVRSVWVPPVVLVTVLIVAMTLVYFGSVVNPTGHLHGLPVAVVNHSVVNYQAGDTVSSFMNLRVANIQACYELWSSKGAEFVTPPIDRGAEIRCYMRDPDGYMIEVGQSTGLLEAKLAKKRPEDLPG